MVHEYGFTQFTQFTLHITYWCEKRCFGLMPHKCVDRWRSGGGRCPRARDVTASAYGSRLSSGQSDSSRSRGRYGPSGTPGGFGYQRGGDRQPAASQGRMNGCGRGRPSVTGIRSTSAPAHENTDRPGWERPASRTARHGGGQVNFTLPCGVNFMESS